jgi:hypothetical protein
MIQMVNSQPSTVDSRFVVRHGLESKFKYVFLCQTAIDCGLLAVD